MDAHCQRWRQLAGQTRRKINRGWCFQACATPMVAVSLGLLGPTLWARRIWPQQAPLWYAWTAATALACVLLGAWWAARRRFVTANQALVRLEERMGLHNRLSAAAAGACP